MIKFLLIVLLILAVIAIIAIFIVVMQSKKINKAKVQIQTLNDAFMQVKERAEHLSAALEKTTRIGKEANVQRKELKETLDCDLVNRANSLFN